MIGRGYIMIYTTACAVLRTHLNYPKYGNGVFSVSFFAHFISESGSIDANDSQCTLHTTKGFRFRFYFIAKSLFRDRLSMTVWSVTIDCCVRNKEMHETTTKRLDRFSCVLLRSVKPLHVSSLLSLWWKIKAKHRSIGTTELWCWMGSLSLLHVGCY